MDDSLIQFVSQFRFEPTVEQSRRTRRHLLTVVGGMGGSHLPAGLLNAIDPSLGLWIHKDYGLPPIAEHLAFETLYIASSHSGNTEETLDFATQAQERGYPLAVITTGGKLAAFAEKTGVPLVRLSNTLPPRLAVGQGALAIAALLARKDLVADLAELSLKLLPQHAAEGGKSLAQTLKGKIPLIYASATNFPIAYYWKVSFNETAKISAFCNALPEANHNEIEGFDGSSVSPRAPLHVVLLSSPNDHPKIIARMKITRELYERRGVPVSEVALSGETETHLVFAGVLLGIATALALGRAYGNEPLATPLIEALKRRLQS